MACAATKGRRTQTISCNRIMIVLKKMRKIHEHFRKILMFANILGATILGAAVSLLPPHREHAVRAA